MVTVEELKNARKLPDQVAIVFATGALGSHARGIVRPDQTFASWTEFVAELRKTFCPLTWDFNVVWRLEQLRKRHGDFQECPREFTTGMELLRGTQLENYDKLMYLFLKGLEADSQANVMAQRPETLVEAMRRA